MGNSFDGAGWFEAKKNIRQKIKKEKVFSHLTVSGFGKKKNRFIRRQAGSKIFGD